MRDLERWFRKGKKNKYDPQIGAAAVANVENAKASDEWNRNYFEKYVAPAMNQLVKESDVNIERQGKLFDLDYDQAKLQDTRYRTLGIPAEDKYYKMAADYSAPEEQEKQARAALGDVRVAAQGQDQQLARKLQSMGINPASPAALSASSDRAVTNAATEAGAATRAREGAKTLGMQLTADAANFGRGGQSGVLQFGAGAGGASSAAAGGAANAASVAPGGAANMNTAFGLTNRTYGNNLDAFTSRANTVDQTRGPSALQSIASMGTQLGSAYLSSDRRLKKAATRIVTLAHDIGLWAFRYIWEPDNAPLRYGYMADEVARVFPDAVMAGPGGYLKVDYAKVPV